jgi:hypothetical protein
MGAQSMSQALHGHGTIHTPRKHIVPTHLNLPDQVLTVWSLSLSARQLLLLLVGGGIGGTVWQHLATLTYFSLAGQLLRGLLALMPFMLMLVLACYQHAGRYLEVWLIVLVRYHLRPKCYLWRSIRYFETHLYPLASAWEAPDGEEGGGVNTLLLTERRQP